jgi:hypothetical protein
VTPATMEGIEPLLTNPIVPPVAVMAPMVYAICSRDCVRVCVSIGSLYMLIVYPEFRLV